MPTPTTWIDVADQNPMMRPIRPQQPDLAYVRIPLNPPRMPSVYDEAYITKIFIYDTVVQCPHPAFPPPPVLAWTPFDQMVPRKILPQADNPIQGHPAFPAAITRWHWFDQLVPRKILPQQDNAIYGHPAFPPTSPTMAWLFDQPVPVKIRPQQDNLFAPPFPRATGVTAMAWQALEQPAPVKIRPQQDAVAWSTFTPPAAAPTMAWLLDQPVKVRILPQADNTTGLPAPPSTPPVMGSAIDEMYTTTIFIYDSLVQTPQPIGAVVAPTMAWSGFDQPVPLRLRPQQDNLFFAPFPRATGVTAMAWLFDQPTPVRIRPPQDNLATPPLPIFVAPTMAWLFDQPTPIKTKPPADILAPPFPTPTQPPSMAWLFDQPIVVRIRPQADNLATIPFPPTPAAAPTMAWSGFDQPAPLRVRPQQDNLADVPQPFAAAQIFGFQNFDPQPVIKIRPPADLAWANFTPTAAVPPMAWLAEQPVQLKIKPQQIPMTGEPVFVPQVPTTAAFQFFDQPAVLKIRPFDAFAAQVSFTAPPTPASLGFQVFDVQPQIRIKPAGEVTLWPNAIPPTPAAAPPLAWLNFDVQPLLKIKPPGEFAVQPLIVPPIVAPVTAVVGGYDDTWQEDQFIIHWLLMDDE